MSALPSGARPGHEFARPLPHPAPPGAAPATKTGSGVSFDEFWPGRPVSLLGTSLSTEHAARVVIPGWVCASTPAPLVTRWSPALSRLILTGLVPGDGGVRVPELTVSTERSSLVVWVCPIDRWRAAVSAGMTGVPGCMPWPPTQLLT